MKADPKAYCWGCGRRFGVTAGLKSHLAEVLAGKFPGHPPNVHSRPALVGRRLTDDDESVLDAYRSCREEVEVEEVDYDEGYSYRWSGDGKGKDEDPEGGCPF